MCLAEHKAQQCPCQCTKCFQWKADTAFLENKRHWQSSHDRVCEDCIDRRACKSCNISKPKFDFTDGEWLHAAWQSGDQGKCKACMVLCEKNMWACHGCGETKRAPAEFSAWLHKRSKLRYAAGARCNSCKAKLQQEEDALRKKSTSLVVKSSESALRSTAAACERKRDTTAIQSAKASLCKYVRIFCPDCHVGRDVDMH